MIKEPILGAISNRIYSYIFFSLILKVFLNPRKQKYKSSINFHKIKTYSFSLNFILFCHSEINILIK